jgi:hypothetical protein
VLGGRFRKIKLFHMRWEKNRSIRGFSRCNPVEPDDFDDVRPANNSTTGLGSVATVMDRSDTSRPIVSFSGIRSEGDLTDWDWLPLVSHFSTDRISGRAVGATAANSHHRAAGSYPPANPTARRREAC